MRSERRLSDRGDLVARREADSVERHDHVDGAGMSRCTLGIRRFTLKIGRCMLSTGHAALSSGRPTLGVMPPMGIATHGFPPRPGERDWRDGAHD
jgi:hypothetical protein